jgi:glycosyltransferase involved in cell wall biosynthesis
MSGLPQAPVALNGRFSGTPQPTGTQTAAFGLFDAIIRSKREHPLVVFADPRFAGVSAWADVPKTTLVPIPFQDWSRRRAQLWEQFVFPLLGRRWRCALAHHPVTTCPVWHAGLKTVVTLHDLNFYRHPEWYSWSFRMVYHFFALPGIRGADAVVAISDYVRGQIVECLHLPRDKVRRIYNGVKIQPDPPVEKQPASPPSPYILCVGSLQPHKNLPRLIRAFLQVRDGFPDLELWIVGRPQPRFAAQSELADLLQSPSVKLLGYLSEADLASAYRQARVFCYPSLEEGFGLPLLEAMHAGALVVTSNVSCLPEIAGPACELVDPYDETAIATGLRRALTLTEAERQRRLNEARAWAERFRWENAARDYLALYEELLA